MAALHGAVAWFSPCASEYREAWVKHGGQLATPEGHRSRSAPVTLWLVDPSQPCRLAKKCVLAAVHDACRQKRAHRLHDAGVELHDVRDVVPMPLPLVKKPKVSTSSSLPRPVKHKRVSFGLVPTIKPEPVSSPLRIGREERRRVRRASGSPMAPPTPEQVRIFSRRQQRLPAVAAHVTPPKSFKMEDVEFGIEESKLFRGQKYMTPRSKTVKLEEVSPNKRPEPPEPRGIAR